MMFKVGSKLGQAEPVSIVILTGVVLAIALAVYGYFASQAAIASYRQRIQAEIAKLRFNTVVSDLYSSGADRYILIKRLDTSTARITFSLVLGELYGETLLVYDILTDKVQVYVLTYSGGLYIDNQIDVAQSIPLDRLYTSIDTPLYPGYLKSRGLTHMPVYYQEAIQKPGAHGCDILLHIKFNSSITGNGYPILIIIEPIGSEYYIVDIYQLPRVSTL